MQNLKNEAKEELKSIIIEHLEWYEGEVSELHHECFNTDYFIIGTYQAKKWLEENYGVFEAIAKIVEYEQNNFGESYTSIEDPEKVCNMLVYIIGEEILQDVKAFQDNWDKKITPELAKEIIEELED